MPLNQGAEAVEAYGHMSIGVMRSLALSILVAVIAAGTVTLRLSTRWRRNRKLALEDYLVLLAWVMGIISSFLSHSKDLDGFGVATVSDLDLLTIIYRLYCAQHFFYLALALVQVSVCLNYRGFSAGLVDRHLVACDVLLVFILIGSLVEILVYTFQCNPVSLFWTILERDQRDCFSPVKNNLLVLFGPPIFRVLIDILLMCIPVPLILRLKLPVVQKLAIMAVIGITLLSIFANIERLRKSTIKPPTRGPSPYYSQVLPQLQLLSTLEVNTAIICANAVTLKAPFMEAWERFQDWRRGSRRPSLTPSHGSKSTESSFSEVEKL